MESAWYMWSHSRLSISRRRVPGPRAASASAAVSTHSRGRPCPRAARTRLLTHLLACPVPDRVPFFLQTLVNRSERLAIGWAVRAPFPSGPALHPEVRYAFESGWLPFMQSPFGPKVYPKSIAHKRTNKHRHSGCGYYIDCLRACCTREGWQYL